MGKKEIDMLFDKWMNDQMFRKNMRQNPEDTLQTTGVKLTPEEMSVFRKIDWKLSDEELKTRVSKIP